MLSKNPFNTGSPARGAGFLGRQSIIHNILSFLEKKTQFNLLLFGQRRIGKTSLLRKLQDDPGLRERAFPVYFNLQDKASIELHRLLFEIAGRIISDLGLKIELNIENFTQDNASFHFQNDFIPLVTGRLPDRKQLLLLFDEFDVLDAVEDVEDDPSIATFASKQFIRFTANLIEDIQAKKYPIKFIFAIGRNYKDLEPKRFGQIMKFGPQEELSYFSKEETRELLKASDNSIPFDAEAVDEIYSLTFGHPYFAQCLASVSFDAAEKNHADFVTRDIVRDRLIASIKSYSSGIYWIWDSLSPTDKLILYIMAALKEENQPATMDTIREKAASLEITPAVEELKPTIEKLQNFKFVNDHHGQYDFYVEFIRKWIAGEVSGSEIAKLLDKVDEDIGFHLNNARYFFKKKDYKQAIQHYDEILKKSPYHFEALFYMAKCYKNLKDADTKYLDYAIDFYKKSYEINRHKVKQEYLSLLHEKWDELSEKGNDIEEIFKEIQRIEPGDARITEKLVAINSLQKTLSEIKPEIPNKKEKLDILRRLNESLLRKEVLVPLFKKMGFIDVVDYHGPVEKGKDIVFYKMDEFDEKIYTGVVVKAGDITGSTSSSSGAMNVLNQIQQTLNEPYTDIYGLKELKIDRCIVITTGEITPQAIESIKGSLKAFNLDKLLSFFDGNKVVDLLEKHMPDYFFNEIECYTRYFNKMKEDFESIRDIAAIGQKEPVPLETIYVSLKLSQEIRRPDLPLDIDQTESRIYDEKKKQQMERKLERAEPRDRVMDVDAAVKSFNRMVIVGAPGAGKTTLLKHLALKYCIENIDKRERVTVPIPVTLRESIQSGKDLREYIDDVFEKYCFKEAKEFVEKELQNGKCMLLLDGFDELATRESQAKAVEQIHGFAQEYPQCRFIVTSRIAGYHDELSGFTRLELMDFDEKQMKEFIDHWFGQGEPKKAASMWKAVMVNESIGELARNPLLMTIIAIIYEEDQELPQGRAALYERSVDVLLSRWDKAKKLKNKFSPENKVFILRKLAYESHCLNRRVMSHLEIMGIIDQYASRIGLKKEEYESFLTEIWERSYLLRQISVDTYDFLHLSFQEYFTALELREQPDGIGTIIKHIDEPWWEEPTLLYAGISREATELIRRIQKEVPEDMFYSNLMLAGKCIADAPFTESKLKDEIVQTLWDVYQKSEFKSLREKTAEVLSRIKPREIIDRHILKLKNKKSKVRYESARILREMRIVEAVPHLVQVFENDKSENVRSIAALALGELGSTDAIPHLIRALENNKDGDVRRRAALTLGEIGSAEYVPQIIRALENDKDKKVRCSAAEALGKIGSAEAVPHLIRALTNDKSSVVRWNAVTAFGYIGSTEAVPHIIEALKNDKNEIVRWGAADTLGYMGSANAIPHLIQVLTKDRDNFVRIVTAEAFGNIGSAEAVPQLIQMLENDINEDVRSSAADALGAIGSVDAIPHLIRVLTKDRDNLVRSSAVNALGEIGSVDTVPHLIQVLENDKAEDVRNSAALALGEIRSSDAVPQLIQALGNDKDKNVRSSTAFALGIIGSVEAVPHLIRALENDKDEEVRSSAAFALGEIGDEKVIPYLKKSLKDNSFAAMGNMKDVAYEAMEKISKRLHKRIF